MAERLALASGAPVAYVAPLTVTDPELQARVAAHRGAAAAGAGARSRSHDPLTALDDVVAGRDRAAGLAGHVGLGGAVARRSARGPAARRPERRPIAELADAVDAFAARTAARAEATVVVAEEAGWGPVPPDPSTRRWLDALGDAAQACVRGADRALLVVAGREIELP